MRPPTLKKDKLQQEQALNQAYVGSGKALTVHSGMRQV